MFLVVTFWYLIPLMIFNKLDVVSIESFDPFNEILDIRIQTCEALTFTILYMRYMMVQARNILIPLTLSLVFQTLFAYKNNIYHAFAQLNKHKMWRLSERNIDQRQDDAWNETVDVFRDRIFNPDSYFYYKQYQQQTSLKVIILKHFKGLFMVYYYIIASPARFTGIKVLPGQVDKYIDKDYAVTFVTINVLCYFVVIYYIINYIFKWKHFDLLLELLVSKLKYYNMEDIPLHHPRRLYKMNDLAEKEMYCIMAENPPLVLSVPIKLIKIAVVNKFFATFLNFKYSFEIHMINYLTNVIKHKWIPYLFWNWNGLIYRIYSSIELYTHHIESEYVIDYTKQSVKLLQNYKAMSILKIFKLLFGFCMLGIVPEIIITRTFAVRVDEWEIFPDLYYLIFNTIPMKIIPSLHKKQHTDMDILILATYPFVIVICHSIIATSYGMIIYICIVLPNYYYISRVDAIEMITEYFSWSLWLAVQFLWIPHLYYISNEYDFMKKPAFVFLMSQLENSAMYYVFPLIWNKFKSIAFMLRTTYYGLDVVVPRGHFKMILNEGICNHVLKWNQIQSLLVYSLLLEYVDHNEFMCQIIFTVRYIPTYFLCLFACVSEYAKITPHKVTI